MTKIMITDSTTMLGHKYLLYKLMIIPVIQFLFFFVFAGVCLCLCVTVASRFRFLLMLVSNPS